MKALQPKPEGYVEPVRRPRPTSDRPGGNRPNGNRNNRGDRPNRPNRPHQERGEGHGNGHSENGGE